jgi:1-acyl-sn-glycerol-3-phosphate acyltransferase
MALLRSLLTYLLTALYVLVVGTFALLVVVPLGLKDLLFRLGHGGVALALGTAGIRYRVIGADNVPPGKAVVFCSNHQSNVDPPVLFRALHPRLHVLYKAELRKLPVLGPVLEAGGFVPVQRDDRDAAFASIDRAVDSIRSGNSFLIFPEGTRSRTEALLPFKKGGFVMALKAQAPIVPVAIMGGRDAMRKGSAIIYPVDVTVRIGHPVETKDRAVENRDEVIAEVRYRIEALLRAGRFSVR